ncbi:hypothetical protein [Streptomyces sp. XD-27]|uniref:hypothetical protein n=1 Tax=Streptomyces sp. XD-27 TaxID=3062779 RepID=UPI0026F46971|nr:hypothetical protein [Streptomyces sp. XD-27]WKX73111.1 hypothetical protein Q3Y56_27335 [Streptomyces sp. XD-27]
MSVPPPPQPGFGPPQGGQPNQPYGIPPQTPPQGYPQQAPYGGPQGLPPQGPAPHPYGGDGWGAPQPPMPPQGPDNSKKKLAIIIGSLVAVGAVLAGAIFFVSKDDDGKKKRADKPTTSASTSPGESTSPSASPSPSESGGTGTGGAYKLIVPKTLESGKYTLYNDMSKQFDSQVPNDGINTHDLKATAGQYRAATSQIVYTGYTGRIDDPDQAITDFINGMEKADGASVGQPRREITPEGSSEPVTCEVLVKTQAGQKMAFPACVWADSTTLAAVILTDREMVSAPPKSIDLEAYAKRASVMRGEVRVAA